MGTTKCQCPNCGQGIVLQIEATKPLPHLFGYPVYPNSFPQFKQNLMTGYPRYVNNWDAWETHSPPVFDVNSLPLPISPGPAWGLWSSAEALKKVKRPSIYGPQSISGTEEKSRDGETEDGQGEGQPGPTSQPTTGEVRD